MFVVAAFHISPLAHNLEGRLSPILLLHWHVQIVNEDQQFVNWVLWAVDSFLVLLDQRLKVLLDLACCCGSR